MPTTYSTLGADYNLDTMTRYEAVRRINSFIVLLYPGNLHARNDTAIATPERY